MHVKHAAVVDTPKRSNVPMGFFDADMSSIFDFLIRSYKHVSIPSNNNQLWRLRLAAISPLCLALNGPAPGLLLPLSQHFPSDRHLSATRKLGSSIRPHPPDERHFSRPPGTH